MQQQQVFLVVFLIGIGCVFGAVDYCRASLCKTGEPHIACPANKSFESACGTAPAPKQIDLKGALQQLIVDRHNMRRSQIATGSLSKFPAAAKMLEMSWDDDLAYVAGFNARQCVMKHDLCRATPAYPSAGQNLALSGATNGFQALVPTLTQMIDNWFNEKEACSPQLINRLVPINATVGHFTAMIQQKSGKIGCAVTQYKAGVWYTTLLACNYQYTNMVGEQIYAVGKPCSQCSGKCSTKNPGLCV